jgi:hypothetical protein
MEIDAIRLTPVQRADHMRKGLCFICHKSGCSTRNHPRESGFPSAPPVPPRNPARLRTTITSPTPPAPSELAQYVHKLTTGNVAKEEILRTLKACYEKEKEETIAKVEIKLPDYEDF